MEEIRSFVAIELDDNIAGGLGDVEDQLRRQPGTEKVRWVEPHKIHLTLKFLGDVPSDQINEISEALEKACAPFESFSLTFGDLGSFPSANRPRVLWVGVQGTSEPLQGLQSAIEDAVAPLGYPPERRSFTPHLTLGRVKRASSSEQRQLGGLIETAEVGPVGQMRVNSVSLMRSDLTPQGAQYTQLAEFSLEDGP